VGLAGPAWDLFGAAARGRGPAADGLAARHGQPPGIFAAAARALPRDVSGFTGRQAELARLLGSADGLAAGGGVVGIHAIDGMAGVGKTALAVHAAHQLRPRFPDAQLYVNLRGAEAQALAPAEVLGRFLRALGGGGQRLPQGVGWRAR